MDSTIVKPAGSLIGSFAGACLLAPLGPVGLLAGVALGRAGGKLVGDALDEQALLARFYRDFRRQPYYVMEMEWEDYAPAYACGMRLARHWPLPLRPDIARRAWEEGEDGSHLTWIQARPAIEHAALEANPG